MRQLIIFCVVFLPFFTVAQKQPKLVITDIRMPIMDGIQATKKIKKQ